MTAYSRREWLIVLVLSLGTFIGVLNVYLLTPFLGLVARQFGVSEAAVGLLSTVYSLVGAVVGLLAAPLMDRYQRKRLLQFGLVVVGVGVALSAVAPSYTVLLPARALAGFGSAFLFSCAYAAASDVFPDANRRNRCIGILYSATGIGAVLGIPVLTQLAAAFGWRWAVVSLLVPIAALTAGANLLPRLALDARRAGMLADYLGRYRQVLGHTEVSLLLTVSLLRNVVWTVPLIYSVAIWNGLFHLSLRGFGWVFSVGGVVYFVASNLAPAVLRRVSPLRAFVAASVVQLAAGLGFGLTTGSLTGALIVFCGGIAGSGPVAIVALNVLLQDVLPEYRGAVLSLSGTMGEAGSALGGIVGGLILVTLGAIALVPLTSVLIPASVLVCWLSVRRPVRVAQPAERAEPVTA
ncbi:MAG TPA: MFS transporter [Thermomicrobiaceae bacterium]|nr:MFS transporter [Thermomicrobiaceae bacterium]